MKMKRSPEGYQQQKDSDDDDDDDDEKSSSSEEESSATDSKKTVEYTQQRMKEKTSKYLTGGIVQDSFLTVWHLIILVSTSLAFAIAFYIRYFFIFYVQGRLMSLTAYETYRKVMRLEDEAHQFGLDDTVYELSEFFMVINSLYAGCTLMYLVFYSFRHPATLPFSCFISSVLVLVEIAYVNIRFAPAMIGLQKEAVVTRLQDKLALNYVVMGDDPLTVTHEHLAAWLQCCGIVDKFDFHNTTMFVGNQKLQVPPTCCKPAVFQTGLEQVYRCAATMDEMNLNKTGCMEAYIAWLYNVCSYYGCYAWLHVLDCFMHAAIYKRKTLAIQAMMVQEAASNSSLPDRAARPAFSSSSSAS